MLLDESFFTMDKAKMGNKLFSIYVNPSKDEIQKYIADYARGWISPNGDLYMEGIDESGDTRLTGKGRWSGITHSSMLDALRDKNPKLRLDWSTKHGITLQRYLNTNKLYIGEAVDIDDEDPEYNDNINRINRYFHKAKAKNPYWDFSVESIDFHEGSRMSTKNKVTEDALTDPTMFDNPVSSKPSMTTPLSSDQGKSRELDFKTNMSRSGNSDLRINTQAWNLAKDRAKISLQSGERDPNYWDYVYNSAMTNMGIQTQESFGSSYKSVSEDFELLEVANINKYDDSGLEPRDRLKAAKDLAKQLKARGRSDNEIIYTIVNRLRLSTKDVLEALKDDPDLILTCSSEPIDPLQISDPSDLKQTLNGTEMPEKTYKTNQELAEDNYYNHVKVARSPNSNPQFDYDFTTNRDNFEWEMNSTNLRSRALIVENRYTFEAIFKVMHSGMPRWPKTWDFLGKSHQINTILQVSVNQLNANVNYLRVTPDNTPINGSSETSVINTMVKVMKSYGKIWGTGHYQIVILQTNNPAKVDFQFKLAKALKKANAGLDIDAELSAEMCDIPMHLASTKTLYLVMRNSKGKKFKEGVNPYEDEQRDRDMHSKISNHVYNSPKSPDNYGKFGNPDSKDVLQFKKEDRVSLISIPNIISNVGNEVTAVVAKPIIANKIPGTVERVEKEFGAMGRLVYIVRFDNGSAFKCLGSNLDKLNKSIPEAAEQPIKKEMNCTTCRLNTKDDVERCKYCSSENNKWVPKEKEKVDEAKDVRIPCKHCGRCSGEHHHKTNQCMQDLGTKNERPWPETNRYHTYEPAYKDPIDEAKIDEEDGVVMSSDFMDQLPAGKGGAGQTGDQINTQARKRLDAYASEGFGAKIESVKTTESQVKVLQRKPNGFDIIDVIDRELGEGSITSSKEIQYKDSSYKVIKHPKYKDCIVIA
jgi:hypothetical protein